MEHIKWELPLVDVFRYRHANLWLAGHRCKRAGRIGASTKARRRQRLDTLAAKYGRRN